MTRDYSEDDRAYFAMLQGAIARMSGASSSAKTWLLPVVTAAYAFMLIEGADSVGFLGLAAVLVFGVLDARYLRLERAFRALYADAVAGRAAVFNMNPTPYYNRANGDPNDSRSLSGQWKHVIWSWTIAGFYIPFALVGAGGMILLALRT